MDSLEFILIIAVFAGVLFWYLHNAGERADGDIGLLALRADPQDPGESAEKPAAAGSSAPPPRYRARTNGRYRIKGEAARFRPKTKNRLRRKGR